MHKKITPQTQTFSTADVLTWISRTSDRIVFHASLSDSRFVMSWLADGKKHSQVKSWALQTARYLKQCLHVVCLKPPSASEKNYNYMHVPTKGHAYFLSENVFKNGQIDKTSKTDSPVKLQVTFIINLNDMILQVFQTIQVTHHSPEILGWHRNIEVNVTRHFLRVRAHRSCNIMPTQMWFHHYFLAQW